MQVPLERVFGSGVHKVAAHLNIEGQHRGAVAAARAAQNADHVQDCKDDKCTDKAHTHHHHVEAHTHHHHVEGHSCSASCEHEHQHTPEHISQVGLHGHAHGDTEHATTKQHTETRAAQRFGIKSFVYHRRRPFHLKRCACVVEAV